MYEETFISERQAIMMKLFLQKYDFKLGDDGQIEPEFIV